MPSVRIDKINSTNPFNMFKALIFIILSLIILFASFSVYVRFGLIRNAILCSAIILIGLLDGCQSNFILSSSKWLLFFDISSPFLHLNFVFSSAVSTLLSIYQCSPQTIQEVFFLFFKYFAFFFAKYN